MGLSFDVRVERRRDWWRANILLGNNDPSIGWEFGNLVMLEIHDNVLKIDMMVLLV